MILRIPPRDTLRDLGIIVIPPGVSAGSRPEETVIVVLRAHRDGVIARGAVEISFQRDGVVGR